MNYENQHYGTINTGLAAPAKVKQSVLQHSNEVLERSQLLLKEIDELEEYCSAYLPGLPKELKDPGPQVIANTYSHGVRNLMEIEGAINVAINKIRIIRENLEL